MLSLQGAEGPVRRYRSPVSALKTAYKPERLDGEEVTYISFRVRGLQGRRFLSCFFTKARLVRARPVHTLGGRLTIKNRSPFRVEGTSSPGRGDHTLGAPGRRGGRFVRAGPGRPRPGG